jgi:hypothetical protein
MNNMSRRVVLTGGSLLAAGVAVGATSVKPARSAHPEYSNSFDRFPGQPHKWGFSFDINELPGPHGGCASWAGLLNCSFWLDPVKKVTGALFTQILPFLRRLRGLAVWQVRTRTLSRPRAHLSSRKTTFSPAPMPVASEPQRSIA